MSKMIPGGAECDFPDQERLPDNLPDSPFNAQLHCKDGRVVNYNVLNAPCVLLLQTDPSGRMRVFVAVDQDRGVTTYEETDYEYMSPHVME